LPLAVVGIASAGVVSNATHISTSHPAARPAAASSSISLANDSTGSALFSVGAMGPGETVSRCINVTASGTNGTADVRLYADVSGALADSLHLVVETGQGGSGGDCTGFSGQPVYTGTLGDFGSGHTNYANGLAAWSPDASQRTAYRFTVSLLDTATQGGTANANFVWEDQTDDASPSPSATPTDSPTPTHSPAPTQSPTPTRSPTPTHSPAPAVTPTTPGPTITVPPTSQLPTPPRLTGAGGSPSSDGHSRAPVPSVTAIQSFHPGGAAASRSPHPSRSSAAVAPPTSPPPGPPTRHGHRHNIFSDALRGLLNSMSAALRAAGEVLAPVVKQPQWPALWLLLLLVFLAIQDRIDRRDPKLALAPVFTDPAVDFPDLREGTT
jgi:hypothetical protein